MSSITEYVAQREAEVEGWGRESITEKRVTVRLNMVRYAMLSEIAERLKHSNTGCAEDLLEAAIGDAWEALGNTQDDLQRVRELAVEMIEEAA